MLSATTIVLRRTWHLGASLAQGGFGSVYEALAEDGTPAVIKLVSKLPGASRELLFAPMSSHPNIIPIWDSGEWNNAYVLVMPRAERSLRQRLDEAGGKLTTQEALNVLIDVAEALAGLEADAVHRDLKPENILLYEGRWCLADFGIARYAEATTAPDTRKYCFTPPYAAPEQWRMERVTSATDVYAFGVLAFELLQGHRPFAGPDFREQHLHQVPPSPRGLPPSLASLITECLYKEPSARPTPANVLARLRRSQQPSSPAAGQLAAANQMVVVKQAQAGASASMQQTTEERRKRLFRIAQQSLGPLLEGLVEQIGEAAPAATVARLPNLVVQLGEGMLSVDSIQPAPAGCLAAFHRSPPFDVIAYTAISVRQPPDHYAYEGRSHSLWFCDAHDEGSYRWFETAFMLGVWVPMRSTVNPFALPPTDEKAAEAFAQFSSNCQIAWEPLPCDQGDEQQFIERWLGWFAAAVGGTLRHPPSMPEQSGGHHRHHPSG